MRTILVYLPPLATSQVEIVRHPSSCLYLTKEEVDTWFTFWSHALYTVETIRDYQRDTLPILFDSGYVTEEDLRSATSLYSLLALCGWETEFGPDGAIYELAPAEGKVLTYDDQVVMAMLACFIRHPDTLMVTTPDGNTDYTWHFQGTGEGTYTFEVATMQEEGGSHA